MTIEDGVVEFEGVRHIDGTHFVGSVSKPLQKAWEDRTEDDKFIYAVSKSIMNQETGVPFVTWFPVEIAPGDPLPGEYKPIVLPFTEPKAPETADERAKRERDERAERRAALQAEMDAIGYDEDDDDQKGVGLYTEERNDGLRINSDPNIPQDQVPTSGQTTNLGDVWGGDR